MAIFQRLIPSSKRLAGAAGIAAASAVISSAQAEIDIAAALAKATPGTVINVPPGDYGLVQLNQEDFEKPVTLLFEDGAQVQKMRLYEIIGVTFENLHLEAGPSTRPTRENAVFIKGGGDIVFRHSSFAWAKDGDPLNDGTLIVFDGVQGARIEASHFSNAREAVIARSSKDVSITGSTFVDILEDGIVLAGSQNVLIDGNRCSDFHAAAAPEAHPDCIQLQTGGRATPNSKVTISNNTITQGNGDKAQPIFISSRHDGKLHTDIVVENNVTRQATDIGIHINDVKDLIVRGNRVYPSADAREYPRILVRTSEGNILIEDNLASRVRGPAGAIIRNNRTPQ